MPRKLSTLLLAAIALIIVVGRTNVPALGVTVYTVDQLRNAMYAASPGETIYVAPGNYNSRLWVSGVHGTSADMIHVVAQNPNDRPVFTSDSSGCFSLNGCSYILVDGIIAEHGGTAVQDSNNIELPNSNHMIIKNSLSRWMDHQGNSDAYKFASSNNILMYNCVADTWAEGGSAVDIMNNHNSLFMRNYITYPTLPTYAGANGFQPKGDYAYESGFYKNYFYDGSSRGQQFGGAGGSSGWEGYDMVAMGNVFDMGEAPLAYVSSTTCEFSYNTIKNPERWVMRILKEGIYEPAYNSFRRNLVYYGPVASVQNVGPGTQPETFTYEANYWYKWNNPAASIPSLPGGEINPAGGTDPQLGTDYRPRYGPAKEYGAHAPAMEGEFAQNTSWFQWAWDKAMQYEPDARPGGPYYVGVGGAITLDAGSSYAGINSYGGNTISAYEWDLDYDGEFDNGTGQTLPVNYDYLINTLGLSPGLHTIELRITSSTPYGDMVDWGRVELEIGTGPQLPTPPPTPPPAGRPYLDWQYKYLGDGEYGVTFTIRGNDGVAKSFFADASFQGADAGEIQQMKAFGVVDVDSDSDAETYDGLGDPPYDKHRDSYFVEPFPSNTAGAGIVEDVNYYHIEAGTGPSSHYENVGLAYICTDGNVSYAVSISRLAVNWSYAGTLVLPPPGDANYDSLVDGGDYTIWADSYSHTDPGWGGADFNGDGVTDGGDYTIWADFYGTGGGGAIPEPATLALLAVGWLAVLKRRR